MPLAFHHQSKGGVSVCVNGSPVVWAVRVARQPILRGPGSGMPWEGCCLGSLCICLDQSALIEGENISLYLNGMLWKMYNLETSLDMSLKLQNNILLRYKSHMLNDFIL